jgi:hypothetical protein
MFLVDNGGYCYGIKFNYKYHASFNKSFIFSKKNCHPIVILRFSLRYFNGEGAMIIQNLKIIFKVVVIFF